jgi:uncharacterized HAD superfamily protein
MEEKRITVKKETGEGDDKVFTETELLITKPTNKQMLEAERVYKGAFRKALEEGAMLRKKLGNYMTEQNIWTDKQEEEYNKVIKEINLLDYQLNKGKNLDGEKLKLSKAKEIALELQDKRVEFRDLIGQRQELDHMTAEGQADTERFSYLVYLCTKDFLTQKPYYSSYEDYQNKGNEQEAIDAAKAVGEIVYEIDENYENTLTENKFLKRFNFANEKNQLIDKEGNRVDRDGNKVDEEGYILNKDGKRVNVNDLPILEDNEKVEEADFEDDLGVVIVEEKKATTRKRTVKKKE